jgi:hypothetical protein
MTDKSAVGTRIVVPIDLYGIPPGVLQNLVSIAHNLKCDLLGLILEDVRLQQAATLPFTTEIILDSGRERNLQLAQIERRHSQTTGDTRASLLELAGKQQVKLVFEQAVGLRTRGALASEHPGDLFIPPRERWRVAQLRTRPRVPRMVLLLSGGERDARLLQAAQTLIEAGQVGQVYQLTLGHGRPPDAGALTPRPGSVICHGSIGVTPAAIIGLLRGSPYDLLILPRDALAGIPAALVEQALEESPGQVLIVS